MGLPGTIDPAVYEALRDVLKRQPQVRSVVYQPDSIQKRYLQAEIDPNRLEPGGGSPPPTLDVEWRFTPEDQWYRIHYAEPDSGLNCGWHRDEDHDALGSVHFQYELPGDDEPTHGPATFNASSPPEICWRALERLFENRRPRLLELV